MNIEFNKSYTIDEFKKMFGISRKQWDANREFWLEHIGNFYVFIIQKNENDKRRSEVVFYEQRIEYEPPISKIKKRKKAMDETFEKRLVENIKKDNIQTSANLARIISPEIYELFALAEGTTYQYVLAHMRELFGSYETDFKGRIGKRGEKVWCHLDKEHNIYIPMTKKQIDLFLGLWAEEKEKVSARLDDVVIDVFNGDIKNEEGAKQQMDIALKCYKRARERYYSVYEKWPNKIPTWEFCGFNWKEIEEILNKKVGKEV